MFVMCLVPGQDLVFQTRSSWFCNRRSPLAGQGAVFKSLIEVWPRTVPRKIVSDDVRLDPERCDQRPMSPGILLFWVV